ncbi:uncharacterized protein LAESUDRAFT_733751 [Laetiporus sulphureus 93-53]|uniref:Sister chromatid cohesion protein n=1 Tax=Laetiporus sulphureus 93-53 TaxID=1314785 RepID=A0A165HI90_9APHY|nr:uncharacterized protein LAESUDRAFT_733751 [Laetiporus sulphureus 93-53]KZT11764.1 hypothetical protein LAESUDRAFT_733751 [Laetiporus sulphureus 93-53]
MNGNVWYTPQAGSYYGNYSSPTAYDPAPGVNDSVQDAHRLLAVYPFASATPSTHVTRHLGSLTVTAHPPSYVQPYSYGGAAPTYHLPESTEYMHELNHLAAPSIPTNDGGYWENARNDAIRYLGEQRPSVNSLHTRPGYAYESSASNYYYQNASPWQQTYPLPSSYQTIPFAQSVFQYTSPSSSYPTPPPPGIRSSSSSLANALGEPVPKPARTVYHPEESAQFFNNFLAESSAQASSSQQTAAPAVHQDVKASPRKLARIVQKREDSPDPLAFDVSSPEMPNVTATPRKRKQMAYVEISSSKRQHMEHTSMFGYSASVDPFASQSQSASTPKKKLQPYIDIPAFPKQYLTPTSHRRDGYPLTGDVKGKGRASEGDDLGGFGSDEDNYSTTSGASRSTTFTRSSGKRATGDRDDRAPIEKLITLLEDIFEAEDMLPPDASMQDLPLEWFSDHTVDCSHPLLHPYIVRKLINHVAKVARPSKRSRMPNRDAQGSGGSPRSRGRMAEVDTATLSRILKILDRSIRAGESLDPFGLASKQSGRKTSTKPNGKKKVQGADRRSASDTPKPPDEGQESEGETAGDAESVKDEEVTEADLDNLTKLLDIARDSIIAAECCIAILASDRLTKQLYSEELITTCLSAIKNQLSKVVYPFVEASTDSQGQSLLLRHVVAASSRDSVHRQQVAEIFQAISSVTPRVTDLICADTMAMSETIIIQAVYIAIGPFFVVENSENEGKGKKDSAFLNTLGSSAMRGLRLDALSLIRSIFANHEDQRAWIIEEILSSLIKLSDTRQKAGQFRLRDGRSIRTVSALLLQLVQTSAHDINAEARVLRKARQQLLAMQKHESRDQKGPFLDEKDMEVRDGLFIALGVLYHHYAQEIRLYASGLDSATKAAKTIIIFLTQRSGKTKVTKNSNEAEYRAIFDNLISDLLAVLFWPEWPAASLLLSIVCKFLVSSLDDVKTTNQNDGNAMKMMALDHLGVIAARLRSTMLKFQDNSDEIATNRLRPLDEAQILANISMKQFQKLASAHNDLASHLCKRSSEDQAYDSARELTAVIWGQGLAAALHQCSNMLTDSGEDQFDPKIDRNKVLSFGYRMKDALRAIWDDPSADVFDVGSSCDEVSRVDRLAEEIGTVQSFKHSFNPILNVVLQALDAPPVFMRTKALKALGQIVTSDPSLLSMPNVRRAIESHLLDSSSAVRDAAVELIGKYMIDSPEFASDYYQKIAERIADTGLGVRKRVIKLLRTIYAATDDRSRRIDICTRIILRMLDEDETVKDLAVKTIEEIWFSGGGQGPQKTRTVSSTPGDKTQLLAKVGVIMGVSSHFKDRQSPLEDLLHQNIVSKEGAEAAAVHDRYTEICEALIDGLVDASDLPDFTIVNCVRTIHLFTAAYPAVLSGSNASTLLPYLKNSTTPEEQITSDYLLRIFRASIPYMPKTAAKFGQDLQLALQPMIIKPSTASGLLGLQEAVACMCSIVEHITHDFGRLVALLRSCNARLQQATAKPVSQAMSNPEQRALTILLFIVSLLCEHCNFDRIRLERESLRAEIDSITKGSIFEHVYRSLLTLYEKYQNLGLRGRILQCLGFLFRAQPALMTMDRSASIMDGIFASPEEEARGPLLKILLDFLVSEASKHAEKEKTSAKNKGAGKVSMDELVGNTDGFAESGVSSAVVQRYLNPILQAALSKNMQIQSAAVDILNFTIKQGLAHPLQSFPVIVALETSPNTSFSARASALHTILHSKHTSLLNARYVMSARASFDYQKQLGLGEVQGYRMSPGPTALLQKWYSLVREKRATRQDFLKALVKVFDVEPTAKMSQTLITSIKDDVAFIRYMAENFAALEYKTQEEVLTVLKYLTAVLSTTGMQLVEMLSPQHLLAQLHEPMSQAQPGDPPMMASQNDQAAFTAELSTAAEAVASQSAIMTVPLEEKLPLMRTSVVVAMIMLLKAHLKALYGISEEKCSKWVVGKKTAVGDRPATRRHERPMLWERLPFATEPLLTSADVESQRTRFLQIWNEDGLTAEPEDEFA